MSVLFIHLILEDVLPGDSKAIGIIGALYLSGVILTRELEDDDDDDDDDELAWGRGKTSCSLKANNLKTGTEH